MGRSGSQPENPSRCQCPPGGSRPPRRPVCVRHAQAQIRASLQAINDKIGRLLVLQEKVERNSQAIARLKTIWPLVAAGIAPVVAALKDWLFGQK